MAREPFLKGVLLLALSGYLAHVLVTGKIIGYIHPRFIAFTWFAIAGFAVMGVTMLGAAVHVRDRPLRPWLYIPIVLPLLMGFTVPPATFGAELVARQGINLVPRQRSRVAVAAPRPEETIASAQTPPAEPPGPAVQSPPPQATTQLPEPIPQAPPPQPAAPQGTPAEPDSSAPPDGKVASIALTDTNLFQMLANIYETPERFDGARVEMTGFVFRIEDLPADQFALVRLIVTCHVAHAVPDGFITIHPDAANLKDDSWFQVTGVFEMGTYQGKETIKIRVTEMVAMETPKDPYIYP